MRVNVEINQSQLNRACLLLSTVKCGAAKVTARAINRTLSGVKTDASAEIRNEITATKKYVDRTFKIQKASTVNLRGAVSSTGRPLPLIAFSTRKTKKGVSVLVKKGRTRKVIPHTFIATMKSGHEGVFWREKVGGKMVGRLKILQRYGPRVPDIFSNESVMKTVEAKANERMTKNLSHEIDYELLRSKK
ncbi:MAG: phage tail protein [Deltaproteobacteria bacterium]|nr:phage tail protein [Deltaproteobacteria bacterium]